MAKFRVGQRIRLVSMSAKNPYGIPAPEGKFVSLGDEGVVVGTTYDPSLGFNPKEDWDICVSMDNLVGNYMAPSWCFEPLTPPHEACEDAKFIEWLDRMAAKVGEMA